MGGRAGGWVCGWQSKGRLALFTSGPENLHGVRRVETGARYVMSMWFTCDGTKQLSNFVDGQKQGTRRPAAGAVGTREL